jgi:UDP-3-O-[3-hydroxymyristoyl] N-acetylglucosamine deacetylase
MDGLLSTRYDDTAAPQAETTTQRTLKASIGCVGVGVHSGLRASLTLNPARAGHGIVFRRTDLGQDISARFDNVVDTRLCTVIGAPAAPHARVGTIEHLMAALSGAGIDNVLIEIDGPEVPILDGSAAPFLFLLDCAGVAEQDAPRSMLQIRRKVRVTDGQAFAELRPFPRLSRIAPPVLEMELTIDFAAAAIGRQGCALRLTPNSFRDELSRARTFAMAEEVVQLQKAGLARGGSLDNAVVVDQDRVLNPAGLRMPGEFARHKLLDAVGDLALAGASLHGRFVAHRTGHALNNKLLRALFADASAWSTITDDRLEAVAA